MNDTIKLILVLTIICVISSALLAVVYDQTKESIANSLRFHTATAAAQVLPKDVSRPEKKEIDGVTFFVSKKGETLEAVALEGHSLKGYGGKIVLMVGLSADGKLVNYQTLVANETPGLGIKIEGDTFRKPLLGRALKANWRVKKDGGEVDAITSATISSRAALECIRDAIAKYEKALPQLIAVTKAE